MTVVPLDELADELELDEGEEGVSVPILVGPERLLSELEQPTRPIKQAKTNEDAAHRSLGEGLTNSMMIPFAITELVLSESRATRLHYCDRFALLTNHFMRKMSKPPQL